LTFLPAPRPAAICPTRHPLRHTSRLAHPSPPCRRRYPRHPTCDKVSLTLNQLQGCSLGLGAGGLLAVCPYPSDSSVIVLTRSSFSITGDGCSSDLGRSRLRPRRSHDRRLSPVGRSLALVGTQLIRCADGSPVWVGERTVDHDRVAEDRARGPRAARASS
jgi:hypothetical protein